MLMAGYRRDVEHHAHGCGELAASGAPGGPFTDAGFL